MKAYKGFIKVISLSFALLFISASLLAPKAFANVTILSPSNYAVATDLQLGDTYYLDRSYTLTSIPSELGSTGEEWIKTRNGDKSNTSTSFLQFNIAQDSTIYVAYDPRATALPTWLTGFTATGLTIGVTDFGMDHFNVYAKDFSAGTVVLGGNNAAGASGVGSMYIVIVKPAGTSTEICNNGIDDDGNGLVDCADPACASYPACISGITILTPSNYAAATDLQVGDIYYLDRSYTLTSIPSEFGSTGEEWIQTRNNDKSNTSASFLNFNIPQDSTVYVGYDSRATALPTWLTSFTSSGSTIGVTDSAMDHFNVYSKDYSAGTTVVLGGNNATGASGVKAMYIVIVKPSGTSTPDTIAPSVPTGLSGTAVSSTQIGLTWNASTDTGGSGLAGYKVYRNGTQVGTTTVESYSDTGLTPSTTYAYTVSAYDNAGNESSQSNPPVTISTKPAVLYSDNFNDGNADGWTVFDDSPRVSNWQVISGQYFQLNFIADTNPGTYSQGSYSYLYAGLSLTNYRVTVTMTPLPDIGGHEKGNSIGIMFRYQDDDNYYRLSFNSDYGFMRLEKKVGGQFTTLAKNARGYTDSQQLNVTVEVNGSLILVYLNGESLFSASDSSLTSGTIALYSQDNSKFDDVLIESVSTAPSIIISKPVSYSIVTGSTLSASAVATNVPSGGSVKFVLDGGPFVIDSTSPYTADFPGVSQGEHTVDAILRDGTSAEVTRDTNVIIGVLGDDWGALGDSITNGTGDTYIYDNGSADGRIYSLQGGYEAKLDDLLTSSLGYPNIVYNEGVPGDHSTDLVNKRIDSILERHPGMNKVIIRIGTNDSGGSMPYPSGLGLDCSGSGCNNTFKGNLKTVMGKLGSKSIVVTLIPPSWNSDGTPNTTRNGIIQEYNTVISKADSNSLTGYNVGPDIYGFYLDLSATPQKILSSLFTDILHPDGLGHELDAYNLYNAINPGSPFPLPLFLQSLSPLGYKQNLLGVGNQYYLDRTYTLTSIPSALAGENILWIMTKDDDNNNTSDSFLQFTIPQSSTVYVAYDSRASSIPTWLSGFTKTALAIGVSDTALDHFDVYSKSFSPGSVVLGGNMASGAAGSGTNYIVIVKKN